MQLLRTILIILLVYYAFRLIARYVLPYFAKIYLKRAQKKYQQYHESQDENVGEMNIRHQSKKKQQLDDLGEYVDYEEIKE